MKNLMHPDIDKHRVRSDFILQYYGTLGDGTCGVFVIPSPYCARDPLRVIVSSDDGWEHLSVSKIKRIPSWGEMEHVKRFFFRETEIVMQLHVPPTKHINIHEFCLHLWRPVNGLEIPLPPEYMV